MKLWNGVKYIAYTVVLLGIALVLEKILTQARVNALEAYDLTGLIILSFALSAVLGMLLSLEDLIREVFKPGKWKVNKEKLIFMAGVVFIVAVAVTVVYMFFIGLDGQNEEQFLNQYISFPIVFYQFLGILTGYLIPACFKKYPLNEIEAAEEVNADDCQSEGFVYEDKSEAEKADIEKEEL